MEIERHNSKNYNQFFYPLYTENSIAFITLNITINSFIDFSVSNFYDLVDCGYFHRQHPVLPCYVYARARSKQFTMHFDSFLSGEFTTMAVLNPPERKLAKRTSVHCTASQPDAAAASIPCSLDDRQCRDGGGGLARRHG